MTYRLVLVDDEEVVRGRLKELIANCGLPLCIVGEYSNGVDAYDGILSVNPDIVISDIKIPYFSGLELIKRVKQNLPLIKAIIVTGFDEFDYAKQAANLNVVGFISKPVSLIDLKDALCKVIAQLNDEYALASNINRLQSFYNSNYEAIKENTLVKLLTFNTVPQAFLSRLAYDKIDFNHKYLAVAVFDFDSPAEEIPPEVYEYVINFEKEELRNLRDSQVFTEVFLRTDNLVCIVMKDSEIDISAFQEKFDYILAKIKRTAQVSVSVGVSAVSKQPFNFKQLFYSARRMLDLRSMFSGGQSFFYNNKRNLVMSEEKSLPDESDTKQLTVALKRNDFDEFEAKLNEIRLNLSSRNSGIDTYDYFISNVLSAIIKACIDQSAIILRHDNYANLSNDILSGKVADKIFDKLRDLAKEVIFINKELFSDDITSTYKDITDYLDANFANSQLSMEMLSTNVNLSPSYISSVLKSKNTSFVKYVTNLRIEKAKELLLLPDSRITLVAEEVGYSDAYYFSHCFKKSVGVSPKEYRDSQKGRE